MSKILSPDNVLFVWQPLSVTGGVETFIAHCMKILPIRYGVQPYVLQVGTSPSSLLPDFEPYNQYLLNIDKFSYPHTGLWSSGLGKLLADLRIGIVLFNDWAFWELIEPLSAHVPVMMICNSHQIEGDYYNLASTYSKHLKAIIGVSRLITSTLIDHLAPENRWLVHEIRNGIEIPPNGYRQQPRQSGRLKLIYLGRLEQEFKRVLDIVDLAVALDRLTIPAEILLVGNGSDCRLLEKKFAEAHLKHVSYEFFGHLQHSEAMGLLMHCDILLLMSETEGLPLSLLEAAVRGLVPVVTRLPSGMEEYFKDGESAFMFDPGNTANAAKIIRSLSQDRELLASAALRARQVAEQFDLDVTLAHFVRLFNEVAISTPNWQPPPYEILGRYSDCWAESISVHVTDGPARDLTVEVLVPEWVPGDEMVEYFVSSGDHIISTTSAVKGARISLVLPISRYNEIHIRASSLFRPSELFDSPDSRRLSFQIFFQPRVDLRKTITATLPRV